MGQRGVIIILFGTKTKLPRGSKHSTFCAHYGLIGINIKLHSCCRAGALTKFITCM